ncbi:MAG TPA: hypothetical protein VLA89_02115, partial [Gemmatimonadales bacterium]|nr:hypothetical protein [Gemmatimonadales bacterium]
LAWHPAGTRTGDAEIDAVIAAVEQSAFVPQSLIGWQRVACRVPGAVQGLGGPPECPEGIADETPIDVIPAASCEGYWVQRPPGDEPVRLIVGREQRLYAVGKLDPAQQYPRGEHALIYVLPSRPEFGTAIYVTDGKIVAEWSGCATSPVEMLRDAASIVFPPPPPGG